MARKTPMPRIKAEEFDYAAFEKDAIGKLMQGHDLIGSEGILKEIIGRIVHSALNGELENHLKEDKASDDEVRQSNRRNGHTKKKLKTSLGEIEIQPPRDRNGDFEPLLIGKWDRKLNSGLDGQIIALYSRGNSVEEIRNYVEEMYGASLSVGQISAITDKIWDDVMGWKQRPLKPFYVLLYLDAIVFRIREDGQVKTKAIYTVYGIDAQGQRDILDIHVGKGDGEGAKEWGRLLEKIRSRGVEDVLFFAVDGLQGFSQAIMEVFPHSIVQRCIVHMVRTSLKFVDDKDAKAIAKDLRLVYTAVDETGALHALDQFAHKWDAKYTEISEKWRADWNELTPFFQFNAPIRRLIYTTNAVEGLHRHMRKVTKTKGAFTNEKALLKLLYLNLVKNSESWKRSVFAWADIHRGLVREFGNRFSKHANDETFIS